MVSLTFYSREKLCHHFYTTTVVREKDLKFIAIIADSFHRIEALTEHVLSLRKGSQPPGTVEESGELREVVVTKG